MSHYKLWKDIVTVKIQNQSKAYLRLTSDQEGTRVIKEFSSEIINGDQSNREAHAAKVYFNLLMGTSFSRGNEDILLNSGLSMIGADKDGSDIILSSFCQSCITGEKAQNVVEEAYCSTVLCLLGNQAMDEQRHILFPDEYKIPYMKF